MYKYIEKHLLLQDFADDPNRLRLDVGTYRKFRDQRCEAIFEIAHKVINPELLRTWEEIRKQYPRQWLLVEAIKAHSELDKRILEQLSVINTFPDSVTAMSSYTQLHREAPECELYVLYTDREKLDIMERRWLGIRGIR